MLVGKAYLISARAPSSQERWIARAIVAVLLAAFAMTLPFRSVWLARQDAFVPITNTIVLLNDLTTALLLYAQFAVTRKRALLALATGYLFAGLMLVPHLLTFPGVFAPNGLLGAQLQTTAWLTILQLVGFLIGAILYVMPSARRPVASRSAATSIAWSVGAVIGAVLFLTWFCTVEASLLPPIMRDATNKRGPFDPISSPLIIVLSLSAIVVFRRPRASILDLWLQVALSSWCLELLLIAISPGRFSLVFYVTRTMGVVSSSFVLLALLSESMMLHARLIFSTAAREQEREGKRAVMDVMIGSIAHELRQPLSSIRMNGEAGARMLSSPRQSDEIRAIFDDIGTSTQRASEIIDSVRSLFATSPGDQRAIDANDLVRQAVDAMRMDLEVHGVAIQLDLAPGLPMIHGHRGQLIQVLVNGLTNANDSLAAVADRARRIEIRTAPLEPDGVSIVIEDSGGGIDPRLNDRMFEPFYSTKPRGMGLGLSICQSIVDAHGGTASLRPRPGHGAVFRVDFPLRPPIDPWRLDASRSPASPRFERTHQTVARTEPHDNGPRA